MKAITRREAAKRVVGSLLAAPAILHGYRRSGDKPNLLFLWTDQQRANTLAAYGNRSFRVPVMNDLAAHSVVFGRCYDSQPVCTPARSTVMTGLWPHQNDCTNNNIPLPAGTKTVPELLNDAAYRTGYMGKWHLGDEVFAQHGFQEWVSIEDAYIKHYSDEAKRKVRSSYHHFLERLGYKPDTPNGIFSRPFACRRPLEQCKPAFLSGEAAEFIMKHRREPWMLYVNFLEPHPPYLGPLDDLYSDAEAPLPRNYPGRGVDREPAFYESLRKVQREEIENWIGWKRHTPSVATSNGAWRDALRTLNRHYAGLCSQVDRALGKILWTLEASGQADNTIIVFTSDHGEMGGSHCLIQKSVMYEEAMHVPLLLRVPWRQSRQVNITQPVSHIDLVPTILELLHGKATESLPGESWLGLLEDRPRREDHVFVEWTDKQGGPDARTVIAPDGWKLILYDKDNSMLFHRDRDPLEMSNLYYHSEHQATVRALRERIQKWQQRQADKMPLPDLA